LSLSTERVRLQPGLTMAEARDAFDGLPVQRAIRSRMAEPWRHYHVQRHLDHMLDELEMAQSEGFRIVDGTAVVGATEWHDCVMDPTSTKGRNETLSAMLCRQEMSILAELRSVENACVGIESTIAHQLPKDGGRFEDAGIFLDVDLAILGAEEDAFARYDRDIAKEYAHVARDVYRPARAGVLSTFRDRPRIYFTEWAQDRFETKARSNLAKAIRRLLA
jgi:predicted metal-dependent HD superfamily phosphohydrolase